MDSGAPYDPEHFAATYAVEDSHFWFQHRNDVIGALASREWRRRPSRTGRVLEVGCGTGNTLRILERSCEGASVVGMELFADGLRYARRRSSAALVCGRIEALPFRLPFALIGMFDVLEHIPDDAAALAALRAQLDPGGVLLVTVPAWPALWSSFDEASGHVRRYSPDHLRRVLAGCGYAVEYLSLFMLPLFPLLLAARVWRRSKRGDERISEELQPPRVLNYALARVLRLERAWLHAGQRTLPAGTSIFALARAV